jgi:ethanolamine ammonia-lyase small subunit
VTVTAQFKLALAPLALLVAAVAIDRAGNRDRTPALLRLRIRRR